MICGGMMAGYCATGRPRMARRPAMTVMTAMTIATIGRPMKKRATSVAPPRARGRGRGRGGLERLRRHRLAVTDLLHTVDDHRLVRLEAALRDPQRIDLLAHHDRTDRDLGVRADHGDLEVALQLGDRALRDEQRPELHPRDRAHAAELAWTQDMLRVGEGGEDPDRPGRPVDLAIGQNE